MWTLRQTTGTGFNQGIFYTKLPIKSICQAKNLVEQAHTSGRADVTSAACRKSDGYAANLGKPQRATLRRLLFPAARKNSLMNLADWM